MNSMNSTLKGFPVSLSNWALTGIIVCFIPLLSLWLNGADLAPYFEFPPRSLYVSHAPFSTLWWSFYAAAGIALLTLMICFLRFDLRMAGLPGRRTAISAALLLAVWVLAWSRPAWFQELQQHTFLLVWGAYIVLLNSLLYDLHGTCPLLSCRARYLLSFPVSGIFWWGFEILNRYTQNWYYVQVDNLSPLSYFVSATLSFSTVLPSIWVTQEFLSLTLLKDTSPKLNLSLSRELALSLMIASILLSLALPLFSDYLFSLLWALPLAVAVATQQIRTRSAVTIHQAAFAALAGLWCGLLWELWNYYSFAKWIYLVPFVQRFHLFEMPLVGFAGYLPFGIICAMVIDAMKNSPGISEYER